MTVFRATAAFAVLSMTIATQANAYAVFEEIEITEAQLIRMPVVEPLLSFDADAVCEMDLAHLVETPAGREAEDDDAVTLVACQPE